MSGWVACIRGPAVDELQRSHPNALLLLFLIARRARFAEDPCPITGLRYGQCRIGDHESAGLSRQQYRTSLTVLEKLGFLTIKPTSKGTICEILPRDSESTIFEITKQSLQPPKQPPKQPSSNHQSTIDQPLNNKGTKQQGNNAFPTDIFQKWNETDGLPEARTLSEKRKTAIRARLKDSFFVENWMTALKRIPRIPFLTGENSRGWKADFDWFLQPDSVAKIMEGKYSTQQRPQEFKANDFKL